MGGDNKKPALILAVKVGRLEVMRLLLRAGADPNQPCDDILGWAALMYAA